MATILVNLKALYPCIANYNHISCKLFPSEDDGFRGGRAILEASDSGEDFIFGVPTYAFALDGCTHLSSSCFSVPSGYNMDLTLACLLPNSRCSDT